MWRKKTRKIKPIEVEILFKVSHALSKLDAIRLSGESNKITTSQMLDAYYEVIKSVCDDISRKELDEVNLVQLGAMIQLIMDSITGKVHGEMDEAQKKSQQGMFLKNSPFKSMPHMS